MANGILAGIQTERGKENPIFGPNHEECWLGEYFLLCNLEEREYSWNTQKNVVAAVGKAMPRHCKNKRDCFWDICKVGNDEKKNLLYPEWESTEWHIYIAFRYCRYFCSFDIEYILGAEMSQSYLQNVLPLTDITWFIILSH